MDPAEYSKNLHSQEPPPLVYNFDQAPIPNPNPDPIPQMEMPAAMQPSDAFKENQKRHLALFWKHQMMDVERIAGHRQHQLPLARIKKVMKLDKSVKMISADAPVLFAKGCELFVLEITIRSWLRAAVAQRNSIVKADILNAVMDADHLNFLINTIVKE